jgi:hypothetical protein
VGEAFAMRAMAYADEKTKVNNNFTNFKEV